jgi:DNA-directed RNA polymerase alpha subunit
MYKNRIAYWTKEKERVHKRLAEICGVSQQTFSSWIKNKTQPDLIQSAVLSKELNIFIDDLVAEEKEKTDPLNEDIYELDLSQKIYNALKRQSINTIKELIDYDINKIKGLGPKALEEIDNKLNEYRGKMDEH